MAGSLLYHAQTPCSGPKEKTLVESGIVGRVSLVGEPVQNAIVTVYPDLSSQLQGMGLGMAAPTDPQGFFELLIFSPQLFVQLFDLFKGSRIFKGNHKIVDQRIQQFLIVVIKRFFYQFCAQT